jgi:hypothetical protein
VFQHVATAARGLQLREVATHDQRRGNGGRQVRFIGSASDPQHDLIQLAAPPLA